MNYKQRRLGRRFLQALPALSSLQQIIGEAILGISQQIIYRNFPCSFQFHISKFQNFQSSFSHSKHQETESCSDLRQNHQSGFDLFLSIKICIIQFNSLLQSYSLVCLVSFKAKVQIFWWRIEGVKVSLTLEASTREFQHSVISSNSFQICFPT